MFGRFKTGETTYPDHLGVAHVLPENTVPKWRLSAYALIAYGDGVILEECVEMPGVWMLPGGGIEPGESIIDGLIRECLEELGTRIRVPSFQPRDYGERAFYFKWTQEFLHAVCFIFSAEVSAEFVDRLPIVHENDPEIKRVEIVPLKALNERSCHPVAWTFLSKIFRR